MLHSCRKRAQNQTQRIEIGTALQTGQHGPLNRNTAIARQWEALAVWFGCLEAIHRSIQPQIHCGVGRFCSLRQEWTHRKLMKADELRFSSVLCCSSPLCASEQSQGDCSTGTSTGAFGRNSPTGATACHTSDVPTISPWWFHSSGVFNALHSYNQLMSFQCRLCYNFESEIKWNIWQKPKKCQRRPMRRLQAMLELFEEHRCSWHIQWRDAHLDLPRWKLTILRGNFPWSNSGMVAVHDISWHFWRFYKISKASWESPISPACKDSPKLRNTSAFKENAVTGGQSNRSGAEISPISPPSKAVKYGEIWWS